MSNQLVPTSFKEMHSQATVYLKSGFLPASIKSPEQAMMIMAKGIELGLPPVYALTHINIIQGKPTVPPEVMLSLIYQRCPGAIIDYKQNDSEACVIVATRPGHQPAEFSYTMEDAKLAKLDTKDNWKKYPTDMLRARCISRMARARFADCISGASYVPEEMGAHVNEEGEVIDIDVNRIEDQIYEGKDYQKLWLADVFKSYGIERDRWSELSASLLEKELTLEDCKYNIALEVSPSD